MNFEAPKESLSKELAESNGPTPEAGDIAARRPKIKPPRGYHDEAQFLEEMRRLFTEDTEADRLNRDAAVEDMQFAVGNQWDDITRQRRDAARKPTLTINRLPAFIAQVIGSRRLNETEIRIIPDNGGTKDIAEVREGLLRSVQKISRAKRAYDNALVGAVACGIGNFQLCLEDCTNDIWARDIRIRPILDHLAVVWDRGMTDPTGKDASRCFVIDVMSKGEFYREYPWATPADVTTDMSIRSDLRMTGWVGVEDIRIVNYWRIRKAKRLYAMLQTGATVDITDLDPDTPEGMQTMAAIATLPSGEPLLREVVAKYAQLYVCSGQDILDGPYNYPIDRIPVFRVPGWEMKIGDRNHRWGIVRHAKDPQRLHNFWRLLSLDTPLPTPTGWTTMGAVRIGDQLLDERGRPCNVIGKSDVRVDTACFRVTFDDGSFIDADAEHPWPVEQRGKRNNPEPGWNWTRAKVTTAELRPGDHFIWNAHPLTLPDADLPIHPYILGAWLGNGGSQSGVVHHHQDDIAEVRERVRAFGGCVSEVRLDGGGHKGASFTVYGLCPSLRAEKLHGNKHIPSAYLRASRQQREWLLQGLMDTDGSINKTTQSCEFTTVFPTLADGFAELLSSLGIKPFKQVRRGRVRDFGDRVSLHRDAYQFNFTVSRTDAVFSLGRKRAWCERPRKEHLRRTKRHKIVSVVPIPSVPVQCVGIDAPSHLFLAGPSMVPTCNSSVAEKMMQSPRGVWMAADTAVQGREQQWRNSHLTDDPLLIFNADSGAIPQRIPPAQLEDALLSQAMISAQDIKDVTNIHEANLGMPSNEVSGRAIQARKQISDTGTVIFHDNLTAAIEECGRVANDLIPVVYDSVRMIRVLGEDGKDVAQVINDADNPLSKDITLGKYSVTATTGPSYDTKRVEQAEFLMSIVNSVPQIGMVAGDLIVASHDVAGADELAARLRNNMPGVVFEPDEKTPEMMQREAQTAQGAQAQQQLALMAQGVEMEQKRSQSTLNLARARNFMAQSDIQAPKMAIQAANTQSQIKDRAVRANLEAVRVFTGN